MSEASSTATAIERLNKLPRTWAFKVAGSPHQRRGVPDIIACRDGRFVAIEMKSPTGTLSRSQEVEISRIRDAGGTAEVARSSKEAIELAIG